jgi:hypothetical protein
MNRNINIGQQLNNVANIAARSAGNAINNVRNTGANVINSFFPNAVASAAPVASVAAMNKSKLATFLSEFPWGLSIIIALLITIIVLIAVYYEKIREYITGKPSEVTTAIMNPEKQNTELEQKAAAVVNALIPGHKEVFHVADNKYAYEDAEPLCKAMGAELATYEQVQDAWKKGADWCSYGWVKGQAAVFPTSEDTWTNLQQGPDDQRMACGATGVNGGYFDNPDLKFGVNCFGSKPAQSAADAAAMARGDLVPQTPEVIEYNKKIAKFKSERSDTSIAPFNTNRWSN